MDTHLDLTARVPKTRGACGHRHASEAAMHHCQEQLNNRWARRAARTARAPGGAHKRGLKGKKRAHRKGVG